MIYQGGGTSSNNQMLLPKQSNKNFIAANGFTGTSRSLSVVPGYPGRQNRKAIKEGLEMLETKILEEENKKKVNALETRIKRLMHEEQRAKKLTDIATEKAEKLLQARERHQKELGERAVRHQLKV